MLKTKVKRRIEDGITDNAEKDKILDRMERYFAIDDRNERREISNELFIYEKQCMPRHQAECDVLIMSVGMQMEPIILSILSIRPKKVFMLHTSGSKSTAEKVMIDPDIRSIEAEFEFAEIDELNTAKNYRSLKGIVSKLSREKQIKHIYVDPTGGRKTMGAMLGTFAFFYRIPMVYLRAEELKNLPVPFTGNICDIENPYTYYGDIELSILKKHFDNYAFDAAIVVCDELLNTVKDMALHTKFQVIKEFIGLYRDWDAFFHSRHYVNKAEREESANLARRLSDIFNGKVKRFGLEFVEKGIVEGNIEFLDRIEQNWRPGMNLCDKFRLVDLLCNADRRAEQGKFDDATARLYRCLEMCSTIKLEELGLKDVANPDYQVFADTNGVSMDIIRKAFNADGKWLPDMLALNQQMTLLGLVDEPIVSIYKGMMEGGDSLMNRRNRSVLAHGTNSIIQRDYDMFRKRTVTIISITVGKSEFNILSDKAMFPKLRLKL